MRAFAERARSESQPVQSRTAAFSVASAVGNRAMGALLGRQRLQRVHKYELMVPQEVDRIYAGQISWMAALRGVVAGGVDKDLEGATYTPALATLELKQFETDHEKWRQEGEASTRNLKGDEAVKFGLGNWVRGGADAAYQQALNAGKHKIYVGRLDHTTNRPQKDKDAQRILNSGAWSLAANSAFIEGGIDSGATFKLATELDPAAKQQLTGGATSAQFLAWVEQTKPADLWDTANARPTMLAIELGELRTAGYKFREKLIKKQDPKTRLVAYKGP